MAGAGAGAGDGQVEARFVFCLSRGLETGLLARSDRADYVKVGLRRINLPQPRQLGDGPRMMVDAQIDVGKCLPVHDEEPRSCHRLVLSAGSLAGLERIEEATRQRLVGGPLKRRHHRAWDLARAHDVGDRRAVATPHLARLAADALPSEGGRAAERVDDRQLPPCAVRCRRHHGLHGFLGGEPARQQIERQRPQAGVRERLAQGSADARQSIGTACADRDRGARHCRTEHPGARTPADQRKRHGEAPPTTAVMSSSISSSGLASPLTMSALKAGLAPRSRVRTTSQTPGKNARSVTKTAALTTSDSLPPASSNSTPTLSIACCACALASPGPLSTSFKSMPV